jgi:hypothetical protein
VGWARRPTAADDPPHGRPRGGSARSTACRGRVVDSQVRFGLLSNPHDEIIEPLGTALAFAKAQAATTSKFNVVVM